MAGRLFEASGRGDLDRVKTRSNRIQDENVNALLLTKMPKGVKNSSLQTRYEITPF